MGTIQHDLVAVTVWDTADVGALRLWVDSRSTAEQLLFHQHNAKGYTTFVMLPDGSKEGWDVSAAADELRKLFITEIKKLKYPDWFHYTYGERGYREVDRGDE